MSNRSDYVKQWRKSSKQRIISSMGGACCICGYNKCDSSLAMHHLDPSKKDFNFGSVRASPVNWNSIVEELRKCILVCHNCHCEIHAGVTPVPENPPNFDESYADYKMDRKYRSYTPCLSCNKLKPKSFKYCSPDCASKSLRKVDWDLIDLEEELKTKSVLKLSKELGCSDVAIHKRLKRMGLKDKLNSKRPSP